MHQAHRGRMAHVVVWPGSARGLPELFDSSSALLVDPVRVDVAPAVRLGAVGIGDAVLLRQVVQREGAAGVPVRVGLAGGARDASPYVRGGLTYGEPGSLRQRVAPGLFGDAEVVEHLLRAKPARRH